MGKKILILGVFLITLLFLGRHRSNQQNFVNVYDWYGMLPKEVLDQFRDETGIQVRYDMFDNNEVLEAKLLASNSGYDVVFPSAAPYAARQIKAGVYQKINLKKVPNIKGIYPFLWDEFKKADPSQSYILPHAWGTTGIIYDRDKLEKLLPKSVIGTYRMIFDPEITKKIAKCGISLLEEPIDVFPLVLRYLGKDPNSIEKSDLKAAYEQLLKVRPHVKRFTSSRMISELIMGETCIAQIWSAEAYRTIQDAKELGRNLVYVVPNEGTSLWIDAVAIPVGAPNVDNAHTFINFLMRPDINAKITNDTSQPLSIEGARTMLNPEILNDPGLYPSKEMLKKLSLDEMRHDTVAQNFEKERTRLWAKVRQNKGGES